MYLGSVYIWANMKQKGNGKLYIRIFCRIIYPKARMIRFVSDDLCQTTPYRGDHGFGQGLQLSGTHT